VEPREFISHQSQIHILICMAARGWLVVDAVVGSMFECGLGKWIKEVVKEERD
jgi:hypothetical protein